MQMDWDAAPTPLSVNCWEVSLSEALVGLEKFIFSLCHSRSRQHSVIPVIRKHLPAAF